jgi:polyferredoxin
MALAMKKTIFPLLTPNLQRIRLGFQHFSFLILMYGGRFGVHLGPAVPCFACPFVPGCGGYCYLMGLQGYIGLGMSALTWPAAWTALGWLAVFAILVAIFGKAWCGWICPFGLIQDWLSMLRKKLGLRERILPASTRGRLAYLRYGLLGYLVLVPPLVTAGVLPADFYLPFCNICPGKALLPLFARETKYLALNLDNAVTLGFSLALLTITGAMLVGMFFKERLFCLFCPLLALIYLLKPLTMAGLAKTPSSCVGCGSCSRACPMDIAKIEEDTADVQSGECLNCLRCMEACPSRGALNVKFLKLKLVSSSGGRP